MAELVKQWNDGGSLSVTYDGSGDGEAIFSSDSYEGIDREQSVIFKDVNNSVSVERTVRQEGIRQQFVTSDGKVFYVTQGRFGVLRGGVEPPAPAETYTRLTHIEATGTQYINLGYIVQEDEAIEMDYIFTLKNSTAKCLFGTADGTTRTWVYYHGGTGYISFGTTADVQKSTFGESISISLTKAGAVTDGATTSITAYKSVPQSELYLFAYRNAEGVAASFGICQCMRFAIKRGDELVKELYPCKRDSDGKVGMLDAINGDFFVNAGEEDDFVAGAEIKVTDGYEILKYVTFDADRLYDLGIIESTYALDVAFQRSESTATPYLFGCVTSPHTASVTAYLSSGGAWRFGTSYKAINMNNTRGHHVEMSYGKIIYDLTSGTITKATFTTPDTVVLGGYRAASGTAYKNYKGKVYFFRISEGSTPILDWYPCRRKSDGIEGFWDCVTQTFVEPIE